MKLNYIVIPLITIATAVLGSVLTSRNMDWYKTINKPSWTPPGSVIGTVWTILFTLITISAIIVWNSPNRPQMITAIVIAFIINAILNVLWSVLFFGFHQMYAAIFECALLAVSILVLIYLIWPISIIAALLLVPYVLWVSFATYLTYSVWKLNK